MLGIKTEDKVRFDQLRPSMFLRIWELLEGTNAGLRHASAHGWVVHGREIAASITGMVKLHVPWADDAMYWRRTQLHVHA